MAGVRAGGFAALLGTTLLVGLQSSADASDSDLATLPVGHRGRAVDRSVAAGTSLDTLARMTASISRVCWAKCRRGKPQRRFRQDRQRSCGARAFGWPHAAVQLQHARHDGGAARARAVDPTTALLPVAMMATQPMLIVASPSFAGSGFADVVRAAKARRRATLFDLRHRSLAHLTRFGRSRAPGLRCCTFRFGTQSFKDVMTGDIPIGFTFLASRFRWFAADS
jgi:hypothetical protein